MSEVLVLNRSFCAVEVSSWQRALSLLYLGRASVVGEDYQTHNFKDWVELSRVIKKNPAGFVSTPSFKIAIPEVIALNFFDKAPLREIPFTRRNIYLHYKHRCCYCGKKFALNQLNLDHVIPKSRGFDLVLEFGQGDGLSCGVFFPRLLPADFFQFFAGDHRRDAGCLLLFDLFFPFPPSSRLW